MALNPVQYDGDGTVTNWNFAPVCGNTITVNYGGKSVVVTVVERGGPEMGINNFDLSKAAFEQLSVSTLQIGTLELTLHSTEPGSTEPGKIDVTWSWDDGFDPATGTQDKAGLEAVLLDGEVGGGETSAAATSPLAAVGTSAVPTAAVETSPIASSATALAAGADAVAPVDTSAVPVVSSAPASTSAPTGDGSGGRQSKRCAAQL